MPGPRCGPASKPSRNDRAYTSGHNGTAPNPTNKTISKTSHNRYTPRSRRRNKDARRDSQQPRAVASTNPRHQARPTYRKARGPGKNNSLPAGLQSRKWVAQPAPAALPPLVAGQGQVPAAAVVVVAAAAAARAEE